jgi:hypothetical protein
VWLAKMTDAKNARMWLGERRQKRSSSAAVASCELSPLPRFPDFSHKGLMGLVPDPNRTGRARCALLAGAKAGGGRMPPPHGI